MSVRDLLRRQLEAERDHVRQTKSRRPGWIYDCPADFVLQHGEWMRVDECLQGIPRHCYSNAIGYAWGKRWEYVEGYALMPLPNGKHSVGGDPELVLQHAWVRDPATGRAYEVTWPTPGRAYLGVVFSAVRADDATWNGDAAILQDWQRGFPLFKTPWTGETWHTTDDREALQRLTMSVALTGQEFELGDILR